LLNKFSGEGRALRQAAPTRIQIIEVQHGDIRAQVGGQVLL
jgi:hypothetical protein